MRKGRIANRILLVLLSLLLLLLPLASCAPSETFSGVDFYFLDVGQGDATLIRTPDGDILIDAGDEATEVALCNRLEALGVKTLRLAIFTHFDEDHIGGGDGVLQRFEAEEVWLGEGEADNDAALRLLQAIAAGESEVLRVCAGKIQCIGDLTLMVLAPRTGALSNRDNTDSLVLRLQYGERVVLFTGDADSSVEAELISRYGRTQLDCDLYHVGHHGSNTSSTAAFLQMMSPTYAVISCKAGNSFGHPMGAVLDRLEAVGAEILRTDLVGEIRFQTDGHDLTCIKGGR